MADPGGRDTPAAAAPTPTPWSRGSLVLLAAIITGAAVLRLALLPTQGLRDDLDLFASWIHGLATDVPLGSAYNLPLSFPPLMTYLFWLMGVVQPAFQWAIDAADPAVRAAIKLPASIADLGLIALAASMLWHRPRAALVAALAIAFVPVTWYVSAWWGQFESIYTLFGLLAALLAARGHPTAAAVALGLALSTKPQAMPFVLPFAAWALAALGLRRASAAAAVTALTVLVLWLPFVPAGGPAAYLANLAAYQSQDYAVLSIRAWNLWWIPQQIAGDGMYFSDAGAILGPLSPRVLGYVMAGIAGLVVFLAVARRPSDDHLLLGLVTATLAAYLLLTTMHDRYSYPAILFLVPLAAVDLVAAGPGATSARGNGSARGTPTGPGTTVTLLVAWCVLVVAATLNYVASAPPGGVPGSLVPIDGPLGIAGSLAFLLAGAVTFWALLRAEVGAAV